MHNVLIISYIAFPIGKLFILPESSREQAFSLGRIPPHPVKDVVTDYFQVFRFAPRDAGDGHACARCRKEDRRSEFLDGFHGVGGLGCL